MDKNIKKEISEAVEIMQEILNDRGVPRNIRAVVEQAIEKATAKEANATVLSEAIYLMDDISNDVNIPSHTRTDVWEIISKLEAVKEKIK